MNKNFVELVMTNDGSYTIHSSKFDSTYHSIHGAVQESKHIFIKNGIQFFVDNNKIDKQYGYVNILEYGFGTGLNALLSLDFSISKDIFINYTGIEAYPLAMEKIHKLNYLSKTGLNYLKDEFELMHVNALTDELRLSNGFLFSKSNKRFERFKSDKKFDIIFFDAFGPECQPDLWKRPFLVDVTELIASGGILITYGAKGSFKRALKSLGMKIENPQGPPGKREITRALKI